MFRLSFYIFRQFAGAIASVFVLVVFLGWLTQVLMRFGLVTGKGQTMLVFLAQTAFLIPTIASVVLPACLMLGLARGLRMLDGSRELHSIHGAGRIRSMMAAVGAVTLAAVAVLAGSVHFIEPAATRTGTEQLREINADLIARASVAGVFTEIEPGITLRIDRRGGAGEMQGFFLHDDRNPEIAQTIFARSAIVTRPEGGIDVALSSGSLQFRDRATGFVSVVRFDRYQLGVAELVNPVREFTGPQYQSTPALFAGAGAHRQDPRWLATAHLRLSLPLYALSLAALTFFAMGFPGDASARRLVPLEVRLLAVTVATQTLGSVAVDLAFTSTEWTGLVYLVPLLPLLPALALAYRRLGWSEGLLRMRRWAAR